MQLIILLIYPIYKSAFLPTILPTLAHIFGLFRSIFIFAPFFDWLCYAVYEVSDSLIGDSDSSDDPINILSRTLRSESTSRVSLEVIL